MSNETVNVLREQVARLTRERDEWRTRSVCLGEEVTRLTEAMENEKDRVEEECRGKHNAEAEVADLTRERDEARAEANQFASSAKTWCVRAEDERSEVTRLTAERDEWRALATKAQGERDQWMSKAGELTEQVAELRALADKTVESFALAYGSSPYHWPEPVRGALEILRSGTSDTNPRI